MDIVDRHFAAEKAYDPQATLATYTDDIFWDDPTYPLDPVYGKEAVASVNSGIIDTIPEINLETLRRFSSGDGRWVMDE